MTEVILYSVLSLAALYTIYRVDPAHSEGKYTSIWSFYRSVLFINKGPVRRDSKDAADA
jgi:hypothetical protein